MSDNIQRWASYQPAEVARWDLQSLDSETAKGLLGEERERCESHLLNLTSLSGVAPIRPRLTNAISVIEAVFDEQITVYQTTASGDEVTPVAEANRYAWTIRGSTGDFCFDEVLNDEGIRILREANGDQMVRSAIEITQAVPHTLNW